MKTPALCIFFLGSFLGSLAGMEEAFATGGVYENYLRTSGNSPAQIQAEVNSRSLALELLNSLGIDLEKQPKVTCTVEMQILNDSAFKVTGCGIGGVDADTSQKLKSMLQTYIRSRCIGMSRTVSTMRAILVHEPGRAAPRPPGTPVPAPQSGAAAFARAYALPAHMIRPISELNFLSAANGSNAGVLAHDLAPISLAEPSGTRKRNSSWEMRRRASSCSGSSVSPGPVRCKSRHSAIAT